MLASSLKCHCGIMLTFQRIRLLLERVSNESAELMARERIVRQQHVSLESSEGKTFSSTYDAQNRIQVTHLDR